MNYWNTLAATISISKPSALPDGQLTSNTVADALTTAFLFIGAISLIIIVLQGLRYSLSAGNPEKTTQARNGIIYAGVGIAVAASGASITEFVLKLLVKDGGAADPITALQNVAGIISIVVGVVSVIMIIVGGIKFITSSGDSQKAASGRNTIIYALVGVAVAGIAGPIVVAIAGAVG